MIPKTIHFIWMQGYDVMPHTRKEFARKWVRKNIGWTVRVWSRSDLPELQNAWVLDTDDYMLQSDVARFEIVYQEGGVYLDTDMECLQPLDCLMPFCVTDAFISKRTRDLLACSSFGAAAHHPWLADMLKEIGKAKELLLAGPGQIRGPLERATRRHSDVTRFHHSFFESRCCEGNAIATHYRDGTWREAAREATKRTRPARRENEQVRRIWQPRQAT